MFPFEHPWPTILYLALYGGTLVLHVATMNYVLAGSTFLAVLGVCEAGGGSIARWRPVADVVRDWLPFALGMTITFGVAPILFVQILYKLPFYTANLLLFHRWMAMLPVLIVAFYLLYLQKSRIWHAWRPAVRAAISLGILACFAFTAWAWTENHLLSLQKPEVWTAEYAARTWFFRSPELLPRLTVWYLGAFPIWLTFVAWQLRSVDDLPPKLPASAALTAALLLSAAIAAAVAYLLLLPDDVRARLLAPSAWVYLAMAAVGAVLQAAAWHRVFYRGRFETRPLVLAAIGAVPLLVGATGLREIRRAASLDLANHVEAHAAAAKVEGLTVFLAFLVVNTLVIAGVLRAVRRGTRPAA